MSSDRFPAWLHGLAEASLALGLACAALVAADELRRPQRMWVMNLVWPLCSLFGSLIWLAFYLREGRAPPRDEARAEAPRTSMAVAVAKATSHCGAGCTLGDIVAEWVCFLVPSITVAFGWGWLFKDRTFAVWGFDFALAFGLGIAFQFFTLDRAGSLAGRLGKALKADAASITAWQVGMFSVMAAVQFLWFRPSYGGVAPVQSPEFWFAMQVAMLGGFMTGYPVNWALVRWGVKERM